MELNEGIRNEKVQLIFRGGFENYNRKAIIVHGQHGVAEASPLPGYFDDEQACMAGAIDTVSHLWPQALRKEVDVNALITPTSDLSSFENFEGTLKVKITSPEDYERVAAIRDVAGSKAKIRVDCNGMFDAAMAVTFIKLIKKYDIEFVEQPCATNEECAHVNIASDIPIALDESARSLDDLKEISTLSAGDIIVLKVQPLGGLHKALEFAQEWGRDVVVSSMMEGPVGLNVGQALARAVPILNYACGLDDVSLKPVN